MEEKFECLVEHRQPELLDLQDRNYKFYIMLPITDSGDTLEIRKTKTDNCAIYSFDGSFTKIDGVLIQCSCITGASEYFNTKINKIFKRYGAEIDVLKDNNLVVWCNTIIHNSYTLETLRNSMKPHLMQFEDISFDWNNEDKLKKYIDVVGIPQNTASSKLAKQSIVDLSCIFCNKRKIVDLNFVGIYQRR